MSSSYSPERRQDEPSPTPVQFDQGLSTINGAIEHLRLLMNHPGIKRLIMHSPSLWVTPSSSAGFAPTAQASGARWSLLFQSVMKWIPSTIVVVNESTEMQNNNRLLLYFCGNNSTSIYLPNGQVAFKLQNHNQLQVRITSALQLPSHERSHHHLLSHNFYSRGPLLTLFNSTSTCELKPSFRQITNYKQPTPSVLQQYVAPS